MSRLIRFTAIGQVLAALAGSAVLWLRPGGMRGAFHAAAGIATTGRRSGRRARSRWLTGTGKPVTQASWPGRWLLIYFGYTFCPDVCPTELQTVATALDSLGPRAAEVVPLFITIDPERDTPSHMAEYVKLFDSRLIGLTGTSQQIAAVARVYRVYYAKVTPKESTTYLMDHSSYLYLVGPDGKLRMLFDPGTSAQDIARAIRARLSAAS